MARSNRPDQARKAMRPVSRALWKAGMMNWKNQTAGGIPVVIYDDAVEDNRPESYTIHGRVKLTNSLTGQRHWAPQAWTAPGRAFSQPHPLDLVTA